VDDDEAAFFPRGVELGAHFFLDGFHARDVLGGGLQAGAGCGGLARCVFVRFHLKDFF